MYTPEAIDLAMNLNFKVTISPATGTRFERGDRYIWPIRDGWQTADLIDGYYTNHQKFDDVMDALRRPPHGG